MSNPAPCNPQGKPCTGRKKRGHTAMLEKVEQQHLPGIYLPWLFSAQSCIEKLADEKRIYPLQLLSVESGFRGSGFSMWAEKINQPSNTTQHSREGDLSSKRFQSQNLLPLLEMRYCSAISPSPQRASSAQRNSAPKRKQFRSWPNLNLRLKRNTYHPSKHSPHRLVS